MCQGLTSIEINPISIGNQVFDVRRLFCRQFVDVILYFIDY